MGYRSDKVFRILSEYMKKTAYYDRFAQKVADGEPFPHGRLKHVLKQLRRLEDQLKLHAL